MVTIYRVPGGILSGKEARSAKISLRGTRIASIQDVLADYRKSRDPFYGPIRTIEGVFKFNFSGGQYVRA